MESFFQKPLHRIKFVGRYAICYGCVPQSYSFGEARSVQVLTTMLFRHVLHPCATRSGGVALAGVLNKEFELLV